MPQAIKRKPATGLLRLRILSGSFLHFFVVTHLLNHMLGLHSLEWTEQGRSVFLAFWRWTPIEALLLVAFALHAMLALHTIFKKSSLKQISPQEWLQYILGFLIPIELVSHVLETRMKNWFYGVHDTYTYYLVVDFDQMLGLYVLLAIAMAHGTLGLYFFLRLKPWFQRIKYGFWGFSMGLPLLAILGVMMNLREIAWRLQSDPKWRSEVLAVANPNDYDLSLMQARLDELDFKIMAGYFGMWIVVLGGRWLFYRITHRNKVIEVHYPNEEVVRIAKHQTLLDASNQANLPHAQICRGNGRCSTCRVQVLQGLSNLPAPSEREQKVLDHIQAPNAIRLACQTRPQGPCQIVPIFPADISLVKGVLKQEQFWGEEKQIVVLFADIRGFTTLSENLLPFDVVSLLNGYFKTIGEVIENNGGYLDKFLGDGAMALFGLEGNLQESCRQAIQSARRIEAEVQRLNQQLPIQQEIPLRLGVGLHCGAAIVGEMGYKHALRLTAIGDTVNTASRLESYTKERQCELIVSQRVVEQSGYDFSSFPQEEIPLRGREQTLRIFIIPKTDLLEGILPSG